jgi:hypothetical protein
MDGRPTGRASSVCIDMPLVGELVDLIPREEDEAHGVSITLTNENSLFQCSTNGSDTLKKTPRGHIAI